MHFLEYIWLDKEGIPRSKIRTHEGSQPSVGTFSVNILNKWNFDASSTDQHEMSNDTEVVLKPVRVYKSPLDVDTFLVLCELDLEYDQRSPKLETGQPLPNFNTRYWASKVAEHYAKLYPWFGCEQEYMIIDPKTNMPYLWEEHGMEQQGNYYCSVRYPQCQMNEMAREHLQICAQAGIKICGINAEVAPSQWEFQVGPGDLLRVADDLVMARYLLFRLSTKYKVGVTFHPKPVKGDLNGSGCHINFSTEQMRHHKKDCMTEIMKAVSGLEHDHPRILKFYGENNSERLTGKHETSSMDKFTHGVGTRHTSVRIPNQVFSQKYGYIEDRRPASNIDPYLALGKLLVATQSGNSELSINGL